MYLEPTDGAITMFICYFLLFLPITIYCYYQLWLNKDTIFFQKRVPFLSFATITNLTIIVSKFILYANADYQCIIDCNKYFMSTSTHALIDQIILQSLYTVFCVRVWYLYFNLKWSEIISNISWWKYINKNEYGDNSTNFFLKYKHSAFGDINKMSKYLFIVVLMFFCVELIMSILHKPYFFLNSLYLGITVLFMIFILIKVPKYDGFMMRKELNIQILLWILMSIYFGIVIPMGFAETYKVIATLNQSCTLFGSLALIVISILYPVMIMKNEKHDSDDIILAKVHSKTPKSWKEYIAVNRNQFDQFMQHLSCEWSVESLCFIVEMMQFKNQLYNIRTLHEISNKDIDYGYHLNLPLNIIPKSEIIHGKYSIKEQMKLLNDKYIDMNADLAINISFESRTKVEGIMKELTNIAECNLDILMFDSCLIDVSSLLDDSWFRFRSKIILRNINE